jgi:acyl carrier protein
MNLNEFIGAFAAEFDETPLSEFASNTTFKELKEWDSLTALSIIAMIDEVFSKRITGSELRSCKTIEDLYNHLF